MSKTATDKPKGKIVHDPEVQAFGDIARALSSQVGPGAAEARSGRGCETRG